MTSKSSFQQALVDFKKHDQSPIIDLRSTIEFAAFHWLGASSFPIESIIDRQYELPSNNQSLRLIGSSEQIVIAKNQLEEKGYQIVACMVWSDQLKQQLQDNNLLTDGHYSPRLWRPAAILEKFHDNILTKGYQGRAIDIGCGAGRDSVYLALEGWQVTAIDYSSSALDKLTQLAKNHQVDVKAVELDIEKNLDQFEAIFNDFDLVMVSRYLHRPLLPILKQKMPINGYLVYQTFMKGCELFGSPKNPRFLLQSGELAEFFSDFEILIDEVFYLEDGRPINRFIAKKIT